MGWKKHFTTYQGQQSPISGTSGRDSKAVRNFQSWLPEVYVGLPDRVEKYQQYNQMDTDSEINTALDTIAEFSTQLDESSKLPFLINWHDTPTDSESEILKTVLKQWCQINEWEQRLFKTFRNTIKFGDQPFIRDPETWKLFYVVPADVIKVIINEADGKKPSQYVIRNVDPNFQNLTATTPKGASAYAAGAVGPNTLNSTLNNRIPATGTTANGMGVDMEFLIDATHVLHIALTDGMDIAWPFGNSILDPAFKTYKQKELLEDSIIIYRVQRAPERRIFYIDVGDMPSHQAMAHVERVKNEIHQRRIPTKAGGSGNLLDSQYNPMCLSLDTTVPLLDGRTLSLSELIAEFNSGKENWTYSCDPITGEIFPGNISWAGVTRKNTQVIKLTLSDGASLTCTPDHKIPVLGKGYVEAQDLTINDSLVSFNTKEQGLSSSSHDRTYTQVYDHLSNEWIYTHRMVSNFLRHINKHQEFTYLPENVGAHKTVVHHKDYNRYNNDPSNLQWMNKLDHLRYHQDQNMWQHMSEEESTRVRNKISKTVKQLWADGDVYDVQNILDAQKKSTKILQSDTPEGERYRKNISIGRKRYIKENPDYLKNVLLVNISKTWADNCPNQRKIYEFKQLQAIYDLAAKHNFKLKDVVNATDEHNEILEAIREVNKPKEKHHFKIQVTALTQQVVYNTIRHFGYKGWMDFKRKRHEFNHRVESIQWIDELQDTGTLTIDGDEKWHGHHTFPVNNSIFVKNSFLEDYFFAQCLSLDTKISLLDGRDLSLNEIITEYEAGKVNYVYGLSNKTFELEPAEIKWAGVTRKNAKVLEVKLDNDEVIIATPDHKFILRDGTEVEAQDLKVDDSLMPLELIDGYSGPKQSSKKYTRYRSNENGKIKFAHATISGKIPGKDTQVHHKDFNSKNNNPSNLNVMKTEDHIELHKQAGTYSLNKQWQSVDGRKKLINGINNLYKNPTAEFSQKLSERNSKNAKSLWKNIDVIKKNNILTSLAIHRKKSTDSRRIIYTIEMTNAMIDCFDAGYNSVVKLSTQLRLDNNFTIAYKLANPNIKRDKNKTELLGVTDKTLNKLVNLLGYKTFGDWKTAYTGYPKYSNKLVRQNHKVVSIIELDDRIDTGDITIESASDSHWFGLTAGIYVHNSADGRGSKVDTLPSGQNLGDIDDLKFFTNKLARALRVPSSYLPTGPDDGTATFNDGRLGTAHIQEYRFTQFCERIQRIVKKPLEREFKLFLKNRGYEIDSSSFGLDFVPPQSFSQYKEIEMNGARASVFGQIEGVEYMSRRFALKKYLGLDDAEILENEKLWKEENPTASNKHNKNDDENFSDLGNVGVKGGFDGGLDDFEDLSGDDDFADEDFGDGRESPIPGGGIDSDAANSGDEV